MRRLWRLLRLFYLRHRARALVGQYDRWRDDYDCGDEVFFTINPEAECLRQRAERRVEEWIRLNGQP